MLPHSCSIATPSPPESVFSDSTDQIAGVINVGGNGGNARRTAERYCGGEVSPLGSIDYHGRSSSPSPIAVSVGSKTIGTTVMHGPVTNEIISPDNLIPPQHPNYQIVVERAAFTTIIADARIPNGDIRRTWPARPQRLRLPSPPPPLPLLLQTPLVHYHPSSNTLTFASLGDSLCLLLSSSDGAILHRTPYDKPHVAEERERIDKMAGRIHTPPLHPLQARTPRRASCGCIPIPILRLSHNPQN